MTNITEELVQSLISRQFPEHSNLKVKRINSSGIDNAMFRLGNNICVRLPKILEAVPQIAKEQRWLPYLKQLPLEVPTVIGCGEPEIEFPLPWSIYSWIDGDAVQSCDSLNTNNNAEILANFIRAMQAIPSSHGPLTQ